MPNSNRRKTTLVVVFLIVVALLLLLFRCPRTKPLPVTPDAVPRAVTTPAPAPAPTAPTVAAPETPEVLTAATIQAPAQVGAGAVFAVTWTGPNNDADYLTIVRKDKPDTATGIYALTRSGSPLQMTAPIEPGDDWELRYVAAKSRKVLGRATLVVTPAGATLTAADSVPLDTPLSITWTGPGNAGDFITIVASDAPDRKYGAYTLTNQGSPLKVTAPAETGDAEVRYVTGQGAKVLARRAVKITTPNVALSAPAEAIAGSNVAVTWTGPGNDGDYITVVPKTKPDGQHENYATLGSGSPLKLRMPMEPGEAELRYMTGRGAKVIGRRSIRVVAAEVSLSAPASAAANSAIAVRWTGPANDGDYVTIVPRGVPDNQHGNYALTNKPSPLTIPALKEPGEAELRYVSGQGNKVLARRPITITP